MGQVLCLKVTRDPPSFHLDIVIGEKKTELLCPKEGTSIFVRGQQGHFCFLLGSIIIVSGLESKSQSDRFLKQRMQSTFLLSVQSPLIKAI